MSRGRHQSPIAKCGRERAAKTPECHAVSLRPPLPGTSVYPDPAGWQGECSNGSPGVLFSRPSCALGTPGITLVVPGASGLAEGARPGNQPDPTGWNSASSTIDSAIPGKMPNLSVPQFPQIQIGIIRVATF